MTRTPDRHSPETRATTRVETPAGTETGRTPESRTPKSRSATPGTSATRTPTTRNAAIGDYGERVAARFLSDAGLVVLARNWRCALGELDLVARDGPTLVVCEVKTRRIPAVEHPLAAVTPGKAERLRRLAERWIAEHPDLAAPGCDVRIDLVAVLPSHRGAARVEHVRGAC